MEELTALPQTSWLDFWGEDRKGKRKGKWKEKGDGRKKGKRKGKGVGEKKTGQWEEGRREREKKEER